MQSNEVQLKAWMICVLNGDASSQTQLLTAILPILGDFYRRRMFGVVDDIDNLIQETLIAVHARRATFDRQRRFSEWMFAIARYKMIEHYRKVGRTGKMAGPGGAAYLS